VLLRVNAILLQDETSPPGHRRVHRSGGCPAPEEASRQGIISVPRRVLRRVLRRFGRHDARFYCATKERRTRQYIHPIIWVRSNRIEPYKTDDELLTEISFNVRTTSTFRVRPFKQNYNCNSLENFDFFFDSPCNLYLK